MKYHYRKTQRKSVWWIIFDTLALLGWVLALAITLDLVLDEGKMILNLLWR